MDGLAKSHTNVGMLLETSLHGFLVPELNVRHLKGLASDIIGVGHTDDLKRKSVQSDRMKGL